MQFSKCQGPFDDQSILHSWCSEGDAWRVEVYRVMFGCRVRARHTGSMDYAVDYCFGANQTWIEAGVVSVIAVLSAYAEDLEYWRLQQTLPGFAARPMARDLVCWGALLRLGGIEQAPIEEIALRIDDYDGPRRDYFSNPWVDTFLARLESRNEAVQHT